MGGERNMLLTTLSPITPLLAIVHYPNLSSHVRTGSPQQVHRNHWPTTWAQLIGWPLSHWGLCTQSMVLGGILNMIPTGELVSPDLKTIYIICDHMITYIMLTKSSPCHRS